MIWFEVNIEYAERFLIKKKIEQNSDYSAHPPVAIRRSHPVPKSAYCNNDNPNGK